MNIWSILLIFYAYYVANNSLANSSLSVERKFGKTLAHTFVKWLPRFCTQRTMLYQIE